MSRFRKEDSLVSHVARYLARNGYRNQQLQVSFFDRRIDLMALDKRRRFLLSVEFKLDKWKKALRQAMLYQLCSDYSVVAVPHSRVPSMDLGRFKKHGVGVIAIHGGGKVKMISKPRRSDHSQDAYKKEYRKVLLGGGGGS